MTTLETPRSTRTTAPAATPDATRTALRYVAGALRLSLGWIFLWAFLDKLFGLGHETTAKQAWINGGSPTKGFLSKGAEGPFADFYHSIAGATWANWLFMIGLAGIGIALMAGIAMRIAAGAGALMLVLMWTVVLPPANNPFMDDHIVYAIVLILLAALGAGRFVGLGGVWERLPIVKRFGFLK
jgi:thiosulfate dehydrogenase [quinone] large subunit